jgi:hypothetical protein
MNEKPRIFPVLAGHFFRRFFDNDTVQVDGDTQTTVVRALSIVAAPGLMIAFFLQNQYPRRPLWGAIEDQYFFVLFSFVVMGAVAIFEWEMLFPDRLDFVILSPLSLGSFQMLAAKAVALLAFLVLFLAGSNAFGTLLVPAISKGVFWRHVFAHAVATSLAGVFAALFVLALGGVLVCVLDSAEFRVASPIVQMVSVMALVLLLLQYLRYGDSIELLLSQPLPMARWMPPVWFLGLYELLLRGGAAPAFAREMAHYALDGTLAVAAVAVITYPLAWARMRRMAFEGSIQRRGAPAGWLTGLQHAIICRPAERATFHFIGQTIARNNQYQVYLAMYCGTGLALALACAVGFHIDDSGIHPELSAKGLHATMPLLLFWLIVGLRIAFAFPLNLAASWVFRVTGASLRECAAGARKWALFCGLSAVGVILILLNLAGWSTRDLLVQEGFGICLCVLLTDALFFSQKSVPFCQPRMPGRVSFPLMLTLWAALPVFLIGVVHAELRVEKHLARLLVLVLATAGVHTALELLRRGPEEIPEQMEGYEGEFQLLGLS